MLRDDFFETKTTEANSSSTDTDTNILFEREWKCFEMKLKNEETTYTVTLHRNYYALVLSLKILSTDYMYKLGYLKIEHYSTHVTHWHWFVYDWWAKLI